MRAWTATGNSGGYEGLRKALDMTPAELGQLVADSGLAGRGGAGFPTGVKWKAVADAEGHPKTIVCNADEGEPGCFKDRCLMDYDPHGVVEGMILAAYATGATRGFLYLRYEYPETELVLAQAISEAREAGLLGHGILGTDFSFELYLRRGAGAYICGEETSLLNSLEGTHPFPRNRPPYPVTHGFEGLPTVREQCGDAGLCTAHRAVRCGLVSWLGRGDQAGTKVISLSGDVARSGNYEVPLGFSLDGAHRRLGGRHRRWAHDSSGHDGGTVRWFSRRRRSGRDTRRAEHPIEGFVPRSGRDHGLRRHPRHDRGLTSGHGVLRRRVLR